MPVLGRARPVDTFQVADWLKNQTLGTPKEVYEFVTGHPESCEKIAVLSFLQQLSGEREKRINIGVRLVAVDPRDADKEAVKPRYILIGDVEDDDDIIVLHDTYLYDRSRFIRGKWNNIKAYVEEMLYTQPHTRNSSNNL